MLFLKHKSNSRNRKHKTDRKYNVLHTHEPLTPLYKRRTGGENRRKVGVCGNIEIFFINRQKD